MCLGNKAILQSLLCQTYSVNLITKDQRYLFIKRFLWQFDENFAYLIKLFKKINI